MRNLSAGSLGPWCCVLLCALVGCSSESAREFGTMGFDGSMATGGARGGPFDAGAEHPSASGGMLGSTSTGGGSGTGGAMAGTGGAVAVSGGASGTGGVTGSGGSGGGNDACDQLAADYQKEMPRARMCTLGIGTSQCQHAVAAALGCGAGCITYVQEAGKLDELKQKWTSNNCDARTRPCLAVACVNAQPGNCYVSGSVTPQCQSRPLL